MQSSRCPSARATVRKEYRSSVLESLARRLLKGPVVRCQYKKPSVAGTNCLLKGRLAQVEKENTGATKSIPISDGRVPLGPHTPSRTSTTEGQKKVNTTGKTKDTKIIIDLSNDTESSTELEEDIQLSIGDRRSLEIKLLKGFQLEEFETHDETKGSCPEKVRF